jgi:hypothetical protein
MAREERQRHLQQYPGWSARDNYAIHKKKKAVKRRERSALRAPMHAFTRFISSIYSHYH